MTPLNPTTTPEPENHPDPASEPAVDSESAVDSKPAFEQESTTRRDRWWTVLLVISLGLICAFGVTVLTMTVLALITHGMEGLSKPASFEGLGQTRGNFLFLVVLPQFALIIPALAAASLSPVGFRRRLGLVSGRWPIWVWPAAAMSTPLVGMVSAVLVSQFLDESNNLKQMGESFRFLGNGWFAIIIALAIGITPAICEEILFRGYTQTRLVRSFPPVLGILFSSALFAAFHLDPVHVVSVFPLGLWLGVITFYSGSLVPAMLGHFVNNFIGVLMIIFGPNGDAGDAAEVVSVPFAAAATLIVFGGIIGLLFTVGAMIRHGAGSRSDARGEMIAEPSAAIDSGHADEIPAAQRLDDA